MTQMNERSSDDIVERLRELAKGDDMRLTA